MRERGLQGVSRATHGRLHPPTPADPLSDDLVHRQFRPDGPDRLWVQDITQHRTGEGWVYLAVVIDAWSRRVVGWSIADHLRAELVVDALEMARLRRRPDGTVAHSDHGCQYTSWVFGQRLRHAGLLGSMGTVGDALDNAVAESFFASLQCELLDRHDLVDPRRTRPGHLRLDRSLLQPDPPPLHPRLPQPRRLRSRPRGMITPHVRDPGELHQGLNLLVKESVPYGARVKLATLPARVLLRAGRPTWPQRPSTPILATRVPTPRPKYP